MTDALAPIITSITAEAGTVPGVRRLYPATKTGALMSALTAVTDFTATQGADLVHVDGGAVTVAVAVTDEFPAPETASRVHDLVLTRLTEAGVDVTVVHVRIVQID